MKEHVLIYEVKSSASKNADALFLADKKLFYWNDTRFKKLSIGDYVFVVNRHSNKVMLTKLDEKDIPAATKKETTSFSDLGKIFEVPGIWKNFVRLKVLGDYKIPLNWQWKTLGNSEIAYLNAENTNILQPLNRIANINQLKEISKDKAYTYILNACLESLAAAQTKTGAKKMNTKNKPEEIIRHAHAHITGQGFRYKFEEIANFYLAIRAKPFVILAGISGTGKTQLPRKFAGALGFSKDQVIQVPVRPDWTDSSDLLGYTSLDGKFVPKELTLAIQKASSNPAKPYFFILDEMNLARVEHYFSDFLSIIETREREGKQIKTDPIIREEMLNAAKNKSGFLSLGWPQNLYLIGTVNMDETTHSFSRKVLDRSNSIEMNDIDLSWSDAGGKPLQSLSGISNDFFITPFLSSAELSEAERKSINGEIELLQKINDILQQAGLQFAYRVRDEIAFYLILNARDHLMDKHTAFDFQLVQKILPRIHGSSERVQTALVELLNLLENKKFRTSNFDFSIVEEKIIRNESKYKRAFDKITLMLKRFDEDRFTSFWL